jgi:hypothetical protein
MLKDNERMWPMDNPQDGIAVWQDESNVTVNEELGVALWLPLANGLYAWTTAACGSYSLGFVIEYNKGVRVRRGLGRIQWDSDHKNARLLKITE